MRSIDDIIDKFVDHAASESESATVTTETVTSSLQQQTPDDVDTLHAVEVTTDGRPARQLSSAGGEGVSKSQTAVLNEPREACIDIGSSLPAVRPLVGGLQRTAIRQNSDQQLWTMFGAPLSQLCRRLLTDFVPTQRPRTESSQLRTTECDVGGKTESTEVPSNLRPASAFEVQTAVTPTVSPLSFPCRAGTVQSNGRQLLVDAGQKPPLPIKPSLPPKPTIAKKPSFGKEASALVRKSSSLSSPACSSSSTQPQRLTSSSESSQQSGGDVGGGVCTDDTLTLMSSSAPTSPTVNDAKLQHHYHHNQQQQPVPARRSASSASTASRTRTTPPPPVKTIGTPATSGDDAGGERRSSPVRDRSMKTTKSEEFLARIHRRSVSPVGTPRLLSRGTRGRSVDLTAAASDTPATISRRTLSKEWAVVTTTTQEEVTVVYRPPAATETVHADTSSTAGQVKHQGQDTVNNNTVDDDSGGKLYKTAIDNIRLSVGGTSKLPGSNGGDSGQTGVSNRRTAGVESGIGGESGTSAGCQLDELISSLIEMSVDEAQPLQPQQQQRTSLRHGVVFTAHY